ncbi:Uncharacterised protein [Mycobacteroides abscessus subsp. massiliense]|nr:Uncharacterised protein [Mycobacteroides abscessus subsp. massiliense]
MGCISLWMPFAIFNSLAMPLSCVLTISAIWDMRSPMYPP